MTKTVLLGSLVAVIIIGGVALRIQSKKVSAPVSEAPIVVTTENSAPIAVTAIETTSVTQALVDGTYTIASDKSTAEWSGSKPLLTDYKDTGTLNIKSGSFVVAGNKLASGSIVFDMASLKGLTTGKKMGEGMMEKHLKGADFFDVEKYPTAELKMKEAATGATPGKYTVKGDLTIKGVTNAVELPVTISTVDKTMTIDSIVTLDRTKWNIRYGSGQFFKDLANNVIADDFGVVLKLIAEVK